MLLTILPSILKYNFYIVSLALVPIPALPLLILSYKDLGFYYGFLTFIIAGGLSTSIQYYFGHILTKKSPYRLNKFIKNNTKKISLVKPNFLDLIMLRTAFPATVKVTNIYLGIKKYSLRKTLLINYLHLIPFQFLYYYSSTKIDIISNYFLKFGIDLTISLTIAIISISSIIYIILRIIMVMISKSININRFRNRSRHNTYKE